MALQASGPISFSQISNEFGTPPGKNLGAYRISQTIGELTRPLDDGIPISGPIQFGNFYSKRLNIVVYCSGNRVVARDLYNANQSTYVIGGFTSRPGSSSGKKVWIYTNETIGSNIPASWSPNNLYCSLITGGFDADTDLRLDIGPGGFVSGAGGDGGNGGNGGCVANFAGGLNGNFGTSAIGVNYQPIIITNRGNIWGGSGGGGGGSGSYGENRRSRRRDVRCYAAGGGGGGGNGIPGGSGGGAGGGTSGLRAGINANASPGGAGGATFQGGGGGGANVSGTGASAVGGAGGSGGATGGTSSAFGFDGSCAQGGGSPGANGYGIVIANDGSGVSISGNARIGGESPPNTPII